jgi:uncharacterized membrane protein
MKVLFDNKWAIPLSLAIIVLIGTVLRLQQLFTTDLWYDEAFTGITVRQTWSDMFDIIKQDRNHPPIYYCIVKLITDITSNTPTILRLFSLISGIAAILMAYILAQQLTAFSAESKKKFGLFFAFILAVSPFYVTYSVEARSYSFLLFLMLCSFYLFLRTIRNPYKFTLDMALLLISIIIIIFTHYLSILVISGYAVAYLLIYLQDTKKLDLPGFWRSATLIIFGLFTFCVYLFSTTGLREIFMQRNVGFIPESNLSMLPRVIASLLFGVDRQYLGVPPINQFSFHLYTENVAFVFLVAMIVVLVLAYQKTSLPEKKRELLVISAIGIVPLFLDILASSFGLFIYVDRYVIGYGTFFLFLAAYAWWNIMDEKTSTIIPVYVLLLLFVALPQRGKPFTNILNELPSQSISSQQIYIESAKDFLVFKYYMDSAPFYVRHNPKTGFYNWPFIPPSVEKDLNTAKNGDYYIIRQGVGFNESGWETFKKSDGLIVFVKK